MLSSAFSLICGGRSWWRISLLGLIGGFLFRKCYAKYLGKSNLIFFWVSLSTIQAVLLSFSQNPKIQDSPIRIPEGKSLREWTKAIVQSNETFIQECGCFPKIKHPIDYIRISWSHVEQSLLVERWTTEATSYRGDFRICQAKVQHHRC